MKPDNPPAFPIRDMNDHPGPIGLSMRDYFAAKAMQGFLADPNVTAENKQDFALSCYEIADAMLEARSK